MYRRELFAKVGLFDELHFAYLEDLDLGYRAKIQGYRNAEDDEYSMSDESIGASTALSVDDLTRLFEVKKVEDFGPDDAKNPRNMQQKKNLDD